MTAVENLSPAQAALRDGIVAIDVVSDVVCPWCYVGKRRLDQAIAAVDTPIEIHWRPFQLDPSIPPTGLDRREYMTRKFGDLGKLNAIHAQLTQHGHDLGIGFDFDRITRSPNTLDAHRLIRWATSWKCQDAVVEALFHAYFVEGRDIGSAKVLLEIAEACGMDRAKVDRLLLSGTDQVDVREEIATAVRLGVSGVPFFIFGGRYALSGAQPGHVLEAAIRKTREGSSEVPSQ